MFMEINAAINIIKKRMDRVSFGDCRMVWYQQTGKPGFSLTSARPGSIPNFLS